MLNSTRAKRCPRDRGTHDLETTQHDLSEACSLHRWSTTRSIISGGRVWVIVVWTQRRGNRSRLRTAATGHSGHERSVHPNLNSELPPLL